MLTIRRTAAYTEDSKSLRSNLGRVGELQHVPGPLGDGAHGLEGGVAHSWPVRGDDADAPRTGGCVEEDGFLVRGGEAVEVEDGWCCCGFVAVDGVGEHAAIYEGDGGGGISGRGCHGGLMWGELCELGDGDGSSREEAAFSCLLEKDDCLVILEKSEGIWECSA